MGMSNLPFLPAFDAPGLPDFGAAAAAIGVAIAIPALALAACSGTDSGSATGPAAGPAEGTAASSSAEAPGDVARYKAAVKDTLPFNPQSFTQGLEVAEDGQLIVGTGQTGESRLYIADPVTGRESASVDLPGTSFGEGITRFGDSIWQLTWQDGKAYRYDATTLAPQGTADYQGEGWGLCALDNELIMSDGSAQLRHLDPDTFAERSRTDVTFRGQPVERINELECVDGKVYANVWFTTDIIQIDPSTGAVTAVIDASGLPNNAAADQNNVLNGIAHIPGTDEFYLTGKRWPDLYRVAFEPVA